MGIVALGTQPGALTHAEAVLLVGDHKAQVGKGGGIGYQGMGTDDEIYRTCGDLLPPLPLLLGGKGAGEKFTADTQGREQFGKTRIMLLRQDFRGRHHGSLVPVFNTQIGGCGSYHGLAAAHITLNQPVHGCAFGKIGGDLLDRPLLGTGEPEGQRTVELRQIPVYINRSGLGGPGCPHQGQTCGEDEEFFENQTLFGHFRLFHGGRLVDGVIGPVRA